MTRLSILLSALLLVLSISAKANPVPTEEALRERVLGDPNAPVKMIDYSSLTCPSCAKFHNEVLPRIKEDFIDTGRVKLVYRDFPLDGPAYAAAMVARCAKPERYFPFLDVLFKNQNNWARDERPIAALGRVAKLGGLSQADFEACMGNEALFNGIRDVRLEAEQKFGVDATPTFIIGNEKITGAQPYEVFEKAIKKAESQK